MFFLRKRVNTLDNNPFLENWNSFLRPKISSCAVLEISKVRPVTTKVGCYAVVNILDFKRSADFADE